MWPLSSKRHDNTNIYRPRKCNNLFIMGTVNLDEIKHREQNNNSEMLYECVYSCIVVVIYR